MTERDPGDEQSIFVGDYVTAELSGGKQFSGEVTEINDGVATIVDFAQDGSVTTHHDVPIERCRLHPRGRSILSRLRVKTVDLNDGRDWRFVEDFIGIIGIGGLTILAVSLVATASVFILPPRLNRWIVVGGTIAVIGVLAWQAWTAYNIAKRKERQEIERGK